MSKRKKQKKELSPSQKQQLREWNVKLENGTAIGEMKKALLSIKAICHPETNLKTAAEDFYPRVFLNGGELKENDKELLHQLMLDFGFENDLSIIESIENRYRGLILSLKKELIQEYDCKTASEKALVDMITSAYARNLSHSRALKDTSTKGTTSPCLNQFMAVMSKDVDRAQRHFIEALTTLKQIKNPALLVNVKANNAYLGQNQQFNNIDTPSQTNINPTEDEIIDHQ